jgi:hypothetical protein
MERDPRLTTVYDLAMGLEDADRADRLQADLDAAREVEQQLRDLILHLYYMWGADRIAEQMGIVTLERFKEALDASR